jgi:NAD(P)-dependent dehydrogenase (short-subunit alcohol dehydrogenase family)
VKLRPIEEQVVVLLGASSGIGKAAALAFARRGARVVVSARSGEALASLEREIAEAGGTALAVTAEATDPEQVNEVARRAVERFGRIDTWVQLVGVGFWATFADTTPEEWRRVIDVNVNGTAYGAMAALPHLERQGGALILVSSTEALLSLPYQAAYAASKHAIHGLVKSLRLELRKAASNVSLTEVMPSGINTPLFDKARTKIGAKPMPPPPLYEPEIAADAILYAAEHAVPELVVGGTGLALAATRRVSRGLSDSLLTAGAFRLQHTDTPKGPEAPDNLEAHLPGLDHVHGSLQAVTRGTSATTWLQMHPKTCGALKVAAAATFAFAAFSALKTRRDA